MILYHASTEQNLKFLDPHRTMPLHLSGLKKEIYASPDKAYAAGFCFNWKPSDGIIFNKIFEKGPWVLKVPPKYAQRLNHPCSIYELDTNGFGNLNTSKPEYSSKIKVKVLNEEKYETALMCLKQNGVEVSILKRKPFMDNALINKFRSLIQKKI